MPFPLQLETLLGKPGMYLVFAVIGFGFGFVLESAGFGNSKKLAAQFYFRELTVLKVMFGAIVTAMVLIFITVGLGILDFSLLWVNPTYLASGIVGGLIMGVGFIVGGFCPGTSLVAMVTGKLDGLFFVLGVLFGIFAFGETVEYYWDWWNNAGYMGRITIPEWLGLPYGVVVTGIVLMALFMFWGAEQLEHRFGGRDLTKEPRWRRYAAVGLAALAASIIVIGTPTTEQKYARIASTKDAALAGREVQIHPGELLQTMADDTLKAVVLDVRPEAEYNQFHIAGARNVPLAEIPSIIPELQAQQALNTVFVLASNDEAAATAAWKTLSAESIPNVYILEGGINQWIATFGQGDDVIVQMASPSGDDTLCWAFPAALGDRFEAADPDPHAWQLDFIPKIKLQIKRDKSGGGCG
ncbi:MAG TPA: YeeE/YedE thiosulfate transporter family protein [Anaerolineae bacterium]|nr:YeeE/YedE thiosulfate transporter family protein [Anaerolineae bacterium]